MKTFGVEDLTAAQTVPQIERFVGATKVYVVETEADYAALPKSLRDMVTAREAERASAQVADGI